MRPSLVILAMYLLLLSLFLSGAQGIRTKKEIFSFGQHKVLEAERSSLLKTSDINIGVGDIDEVILCKDGHCSSTTTGMNRKLLITTTTTIPLPPSSTTISKNEKINIGEKNYKANPTTSKSKSSSVFTHGETLGEQGNNFPTNSPPPPPTSVHHHQHSSRSDSEIFSHDDHYVDATDISEMDYSPARRKPPIHN